MAASEGKNVATESLSMAVASKTKTKSKPGIFSWIWNFFFRGGKEDFEKKLEHLSKEEATIHARLKNRSQTWRRLARTVILYSIILEGVAMAFAYMSTRTEDLSWQMRAVRVLPVFALPLLAALLYSGCFSLIQMWNRKDQKTVDKLRNEKHAKLAELKERNNFYTMLQQIQRYDPDPALRDAAARVLASKIGEETGLNVTIQSETGVVEGKGTSHTTDSAQSTGLRNRKQPSGRNPESGTGMNEKAIQDSHPAMPANNTIGEPMQHGQIVEHHQGGKGSEGGWISRLAAMLVGEDPTQCYALICGSCRMHNGLARKEDFQYITYYCPHCGALNGSKDTGIVDKAALPETFNSRSQEDVSVEKMTGNKDEGNAGDPEPKEKMAGGSSSEVTEKSVKADHIDKPEQKQPTSS